VSTYIRSRAKRLGLKIEDATQPFTAIVNDKDVAKAAQKDPERCALARACMRREGVRAAYFFRSCAWLEYDKKIVRYLLDAAAQREIHAFDKTRAFEPGNYKLKVPAQSRTLDSKLAAQKVYLKHPEKTRTLAASIEREKRTGRHQPKGGARKQGVRRRETNVRRVFQP